MRSEKCQERTSARGYGRLIRSERRSRTHPVLLQKIYKGAHLRQKQAVAQGLLLDDSMDAWAAAGRPRVQSLSRPSARQCLQPAKAALRTSPAPAKAALTNVCRSHLRKAGLECAKIFRTAPSWKPFRHAWYIAEGQAVLLDQVVGVAGLAAPAQIVRRGAGYELRYRRACGQPDLRSSSGPMRLQHRYLPRRDVPADPPAHQIQNRDPRSGPPESRRQH